MMTVSANKSRSTAMSGCKSGQRLFARACHENALRELRVEVQGPPPAPFVGRNFSGSVDGPLTIANTPVVFTALAGD